MGLLMGKGIDKLSAVALKNPEPGRHWDGNGLYLEVTEAGGRYWRLKYRYGGKEKRLALGVFPEVTLAEARKRRDEARARLRANVDPGEHRKASRDEAERVTRGTFGAVCAEWLAFKSKSWADETRRKAEFVTSKYLLPSLKNKSVSTLGSKDVTAVLRRIAEETPDLARKGRQFAQGVIKYAISEGLREDGKLLMLDGALPKVETGHIPARINPDGIAPLLAAIRNYESPVTRAALLMCAYTAQRPGMVASMRWDELELDAGEWRVPAHKMKMRHAHIVPLPRQALALVDEMRAFSGERHFVFPPLARQATPHLHRDALSAALRRMGFRGKHATHGFRGMFRTAGRERLNIAPDVLEAQLAHAKKGQVQKAYDRTTFDAKRPVEMQRWADWLDKLATPASVTRIRSGQASA